MITLLFVEINIKLRIVNPMVTGLRQGSKSCQWVTPCYIVTIMSCAQVSVGLRVVLPHSVMEPAIGFQYHSFHSAEADMNPSEKGTMIIAGSFFLSAAADSGEVTLDCCCINFFPR